MVWNLSFQIARSPLRARMVTTYLIWHYANSTAQRSCAQFGRARLRLPRTECLQEAAGGKASRYSVGYPASVQARQPPSMEMTFV
jgi:hypothetical protein